MHRSFIFPCLLLFSLGTASCAEHVELAASGSASGSGGGRASESTGASGTAGRDGGRGGSGPCDGSPGPAMVAVETAAHQKFCIDSTEVPNSDYAEFLAAGVPASSQPVSCRWNTSYLPWNGAIAAPADHPVQAINWCDALAYCTWAGKRLCGKVGGGQLGVGDLGNPMTSEWTYACTAGGARAYPYGNTYDPTACVTRLLEPEHPLHPVASATRCVGGFPGLHDMSGNVMEYQDYEVGDGGAGDDVILQGGDAYTVADTSTCGFTILVPRDWNVGPNGIRCCKDYPQGTDQ